MKSISVHIIVFGFALLHSLLAYVCRVAGLPDEMILTLFTMLMIAIVCYRSGMGIEFTAIAVVLGNLVGYAFGYFLQPIIGDIRLNPMAVAPTSTFITTIVIGYLTIGGSHVFKTDTPIKLGGSDLVWTSAAIATVFLARLTVSVLFNYKFISEAYISDRKVYFLASFAALVLVLFLFLSSYVLYAKKKADKEREKRHLAQFRYMKLVHQVNPHFLFNSLNILDGLVCDGENDLASTYIHKLASLYRYMLKNEDERTVKIKDEMDFVEKYIDLLKVRFQDGLIVETDIVPESLQKNVVPCSIQLLIENATKHNAVLPSNPLKINISISEEKVTVTNNLCPKVSPVASTGLGLKYITQQYEDLSGKSISITHNETSYSVELPLI